MTPQQMEKLKQDFQLDPATPLEDMGAPVLVIPENLQYLLGTAAACVIADHAGRALGDVIISLLN